MVATSQLSSPEKLCSEIQRSVRTSNLHFTMQETPFSLYITVRKKLVDAKVEVHTENELLKTELVNLKDKCYNLSQNNNELRLLVQNKEKDCKEKDDVIHNLNMKLEKSKGEVQENYIKCEDFKTKHDILSEAYKKAADNLSKSKSDNENLKQELKDTMKALKSKQKEEIRVSTKLSNLEASVKTLKHENKEVIAERKKLEKEKAKLEIQVVKLKERKPSISKSTTTIPAYRSEASTSTVAMSSESSQFLTSTKESQTEHHPDIPYEINAPLPPIFSSSLVHNSKQFFFSRSQT